MLSSRDRASEAEDSAEAEDLDSEAEEEKGLVIAHDLIQEEETSEDETAIDKAETIAEGTDIQDIQEEASVLGNRKPYIVQSDITNMNRQSIIATSLILAGFLLVSIAFAGARDVVVPQDGLPEELGVFFDKTGGNSANEIIEILTMNAKKPQTTCTPALAGAQATECVDDIPNANLWKCVCTPAGVCSWNNIQECTQAVCATSRSC